MRVFLEESRNWIDRLSEKGDPPQCGWASSNHLGAWREQKCGAGTSAFCPQKSTFTPGSHGSQAFGLSLNYTSIFGSPSC